MEKLSEATIGYRKNKEISEKWVQLFNTSYFRVSAVSELHLVILNIYIVLNKIMNIEQYVCVLFLYH